MKKRWEEKAEELEYQNLWAFIEDTIEQCHFYEGEEPAQLLSIVPNLTVELESGETAAFDRPQEEVIATSGKPKGCPAESKHRKGIFCKFCRKVI